MIPFDKSKIKNCRKMGYMILDSLRMIIYVFSEIITDPRWFIFVIIFGFIVGSH